MEMFLLPNEWEKRQRKVYRTPEYYAYQKEYRRKNAAKRSAYNKQFLADPKNMMRHRKSVRANYEKNREYWLARGREHYAKNKKRKHAKEKERYWNDLDFRLRLILRKHSQKLVRFGWKKNTRSVQLLGCSIGELRAHIEKQFKPGMTWENYGFRGWHIDHKTPLSLVDPRNDADVRRVMHYTNLQPLWWRENISKGNRVA